MQRLLIQPCLRSLVDFEIGISRLSLFSKARRRARMFAIFAEARLADERPITFLGLQAIVT